jgi:dihydroneopterin aldolase
MKELWDSSNETYAQVEKVATSLKKKVVSTFKLTTNLSLSYEKESDLQKENLNKVRIRMTV